MKKIIDYIKEENNNSFNFNISKIGTGKKEDMLLFQKIQKQIIENQKETELYIDCGKLGECKVKFYNFRDKWCNISIQLKDLGNLIKFEKHVVNEFLNDGTCKDMYMQVMNILNRIKEKL